MSMAHWVCAGIGFEQSVLEPLLDGDKLLKLLREEYSCEEITDEDLGEDYTCSNNEDRVGILMDCFVVNEDYQLPELLTKKDGKNVLSYGSNNEGRYFLLYSPRYPWDESGGFQSLKEVTQYICDLVRPYCRDDVSEETILAIIDPEIYEYGCG